ncbi:MAG: ABC transporter ATP-binding protein [Candidatus Bathyarchaeia archaeon]
MLKLVKVNIFRGESYIVRDISLKVERGQSVCIIGRNGAGKTTTLKGILGLLPVRSGQILFEGKDITSIPTEEKVKLGIGYAPEDRRIYPDFTVEENIELGLRLLPQNDRVKIKNEIFELFPELKPLSKNKGLYLSGGEQKMLAISRALALAPKLLILDEPMEGLAPIIVRRLAEAINDIKKRNISLLVAESNISNALKVADYCYVIERGEIIFEGKPQELLENHNILRIVRGL